MNIDPDIIGAVAATLTTICFIPQAVRVIRTRDTAAISLWMYILFTCGVFCWFIFGIMIASLPVIIANIITFILSVTILVVKIRNG